ncbi:hypothetical protein J2S55_000674 [Streptosporangium brasiliense]|uniref:Uncharacterized protein n=1 Tax=Streptosporangium brasiliense TaxID=47480 RepID=A0ABT9QYZ1_9ACTN|nr:hypothetical protein [Streptosporangium brasiliense]
MFEIFLEVEEGFTSSLLNSVTNLSRAGAR